MQKKSSVYSYLEKYCLFYLSKYSVTKNKLKSKIEYKLKNDFFKKKINKSQLEEGLVLVSRLVEKFVNLKVINDKNLMRIKIDSFMSTGMSLKQIYIKLVQCKFETYHIEAALNELKKQDNICEVLIRNYCKKKKKFNYDSNWDIKDDNYRKKNLNKMITSGFNINDCLNYLNKLRCK